MTPGVPPWGCPWHGLADFSSLKLANGKTIKFSMDNPGEQWQSGATILIKHPLAVAIERTPEQTADDATTGRAWWDRAVMGAGNLHGKWLGGWLYIDPAGAVWHVTTNIGLNHYSGGQAEITLSRFGVLGAKREVYTYPLTVPDLGQDAPSLNGLEDLSGDLRHRLWHATQTGDRAAYEIAVRVYTRLSKGDFMYWRPVGWFEIALTGPGTACTPVVTVIKNRAQTIGPVIDEPPQGQPDSWQTATGGSTSKIYLKNTSEPVMPGYTYQRLVQHTAYNNATGRQGFSGYTVGIHYDETGKRHEWTISELVTIKLNSPAGSQSGPREYDSYSNVNGSVTTHTHSEFEYRLAFALDGAEVKGWSIKWFEDISETATWDSASTGTVTATGQGTFTPGATVPYAGSYQWGPTDATPFGSVGGLALGVYLFAPHYVEEVTAYMGLTRSVFSWYDKDGNPTRVRLVPLRYSNLFFGGALIYENPDGTIKTVELMPDGLTPKGVKDLPELGEPVKSLINIYGSWSPVTDEATRSIKPICYI